MNADLAKDIRILVNYAWESEDQVADIGRGIRTYMEEVDKRLERLDKMEEKLNSLPSDIVDKHFGEFKSA